MLEKDLVLFLVTLSVFTYTEHTHHKKLPASAEV